MAKETPVAVQMDTAGAPRSLTVSGQRYRILELIRQWDRGHQRSFEVRLDDGHTAILRLDRRTARWVLADMRGRAKPA